VILLHLTGLWALDLCHFTLKFQLSCNGSLWLSGLHQIDAPAAAAAAAALTY